MFPAKEEFDSLISQLEDLDLANDSAEREIYNIFKRLNTFPVVSYPIPEDFPITRARLNENNKRFVKTQEVWYKPEEYNTGFGRASNPHLNIMYGVFDPYPANDDTDKPVERFTAMCEISNIYFSEPEEIKTETVTFARFYPGKQLNLICPFDFSKLSSESPILADMNDVFDKLVSEKKEYGDQILRFNKFISNQFSKYPIENESEYKITALFTECIINMGFDGVIYPSVKTDLRGFNVAVNSAVVEEYFQLFAVCECTHYQKRKYSILNNDLLTYEINEDGTFELSPDHPYKKSEKELLEDIARNAG